jgi:hypothetical protein
MEGRMADRGITQADGVGIVAAVLLVVAVIVAVVFLVQALPG